MTFVETGCLQMEKQGGRLMAPMMPTTLCRTEGTYHLQGQMYKREGQFTAVAIDSRQTCTQEGFMTQA